MRIEAIAQIAMRDDARQRMRELGREQPEILQRP